MGRIGFMSQTDYSDTDLVYLLVDYGDVFLRQATTEMLRSAMRAMPGVNIVQLHDEKTRVHPFANAALKFERDVAREELATFKGWAFAAHAMQTERQTIFTDVDVIWSGAGAAETLRQYQPGSIGVLYRDVPDLKIMPYNTGMILYQPKARTFWREYQAMCESCKEGFRAWWADQLAMSAMIGHHSEAQMVCQAHIELLDMDAVVPAPNAPPTEPMRGWAVHFKGKRKEWLVKYARVLDGGRDFDALDPARYDKVYHTTAGGTTTERPSPQQDYSPHPLYHRDH
jgi:hypothetical protein